MSSIAFRVLCVGLPDLPVQLAAAAAAPGAGDWAGVGCTAAEAPLRLAATAFDAVVTTSAWPDWELHAGATAVVVVVVAADCTGAEQCAHLQAGAQDVLSPAQIATADGIERLRFAVHRQRRRNAERPAHATDVLTGLPHEGQLVEHMSHLLALREREPAPMALLVARVEGLATAQARYGEATAAALRRKLAVRLRGAVRASDVVATIAGDAFAVLLSSIESAADTGIVEAKLRAALGDTFRTGGHDLAVAVALGVALYPQDGTQPRDLLRRAAGLAASAQAQGRLGHVNVAESDGASAPQAANDE